MFRDMSGIRFLIVDEADRIVEEGHFPEVSQRVSERERESGGESKSERVRKKVCVCVRER